MSLTVAFRMKKGEQCSQALETDGGKGAVAALSEGINHIKKSNMKSQELALMVRKLKLKSRLHPDQPAAEKLVVIIKW